jgi:hypothetical protein
MLHASIAETTGSHNRRSARLGVSALAASPTPQYATTTQMSGRERGCHDGQRMSSLEGGGQHRENGKHEGGE